MRPWAAVLGCSPRCPCVPVEGPPILQQPVGTTVLLLFLWLLSLLPLMTPLDGEFTMAGDFTMPPKPRSQRLRGGQEESKFVPFQRRPSLTTPRDLGPVPCPPQEPGPGFSLDPRVGALAGPWHFRRMGPAPGTLQTWAI